MEGYALIPLFPWQAARFCMTVKRINASIKELTTTS